MSHVRTVRVLYKRIIKLHELLPPDLKAIGDRYFKEEFKRHKSATPEFAAPFLAQWIEYANILEAQLANGLSQGKELNPEVGENIPEQVLNKYFSGEQIVQLHELMKETSKPSTQFNITEENGKYKYLHDMTKKKDPIEESRWARALRWISRRRDVAVDYSDSLDVWKELGGSPLKEDRTTCEQKSRCND